MNRHFFAALHGVTHSWAFLPTTGFLGLFGAGASCVVAQAQAAGELVPPWLNLCGNFAGIIVVVFLFLRYLTERDKENREAHATMMSQSLAASEKVSQHLELLLVQLAKDSATREKKE